MNAQRFYQITIFSLLVLALAHQLLQKGFGIYLPFLHCYLDDVLAMPIILALWRWERNWWWRIPTLRKRDILFLTCVVIVLFEGMLPHYSTSYTADWADGIAYGAGSILFWWCQPQQKSYL